MVEVISVSLGEVVLKGKNRSYFVKRIIKQIKKVIGSIGYDKIYQEMGKIYIIGNPNTYEEIMKKVQYVFGIVYISPCYRVDKDLTSIQEGAKKIVDDYLNTHPKTHTFKADTTRADKNYPFISPEINRHLGGAILSTFPSLKVDVHNPDFYLYCDIKSYGYLYIRKIKAYGGLPLGTNGKGLLLLSGGIDSPVAGFLMAKRGVEVHGVHYHSYPFTSERAEKKVHKLAEILSDYTGSFTFHSVNILPIQKEINKYCPQDQMTILSRRFMMRIAHEIAKIYGYDSIITGESLGQVASQTIHGITVTNAMTNLPVFRPLIGMDKVDIIKISEDIGTYETSILPFDDCCTVFLPKHPILKPTKEIVEKSESSLDVEFLVKEAVENSKIIRIGE
ncbi:MAG: tRNA uracil 4-sulfurtransferase ThiI [Tissierellia bacterium]|nr:tRNA uracil 4-sulfurtransferase ThiI [Tissierellia bacterium]